MKIIIRIVGGLLLFTAVILLLFYLDIMWKSPPHYHVDSYQAFEVPIMDMAGYDSIRATHRRPYIYSIVSKSGGSLHILGLEHSKNPDHPQFDTLRTIWTRVKPDVAMVEGRLGFFFSWFMNPVELYGASGLTARLAKRDDAELYTWEPTRQNEIDMLLQEHSARQLAMFYTFRPYFSNMRHGKPDNPEEKLQEYLENRTDYEHLRNIYTHWSELDSTWQREYPDMDWRTYSDERGWPNGYLYDIWNSSNLARDRHLVQAISKLVEEGNTVFVTMGTSHAPRIEQVLKKEINSL